VLKMLISMHLGWPWRVRVWISAQEYERDGRMRRLGHRKI
jgi:hypothetical protein